MAKNKKASKRTSEDALLNTNFTELADLEDYESAPRHFKEEDTEEGLPIIVDGKVQQVKRRKKEQGREESDDELSSSDEEQAQDSHSNEEEEDKNSVDNMDTNALKELIALFAELITTDPETHLSKLKDLVTKCERTRKTRYRQLLIMSLAHIFKNIAPMYRIQELSAAQQAEKVSKEVKQLRDYEQGLLQSYFKFVKILGSGARQGRSSDQKNRYIMSCTCLEICCDLVLNLAHFNYRQELVVTIVDKLSSQRVDQTYTKCINTLIEVFDQDKEGHVSFEAVQAIVKMIKARRYKVDSRVVQLLTHLRLLTELQGRADLERLEKQKPQSLESILKMKKKDRVHLTKAQRKMRAEQKQIDEEMRKAELGVSAQMRERLQAQTLKLVFVLYMNILKLRARNLLGATLEGLTSYSHLINSELFGDLLEVLREILETSDLENSRQVMLCVYTSFQLLKGQGAGWEESMDLGFFIEKLYVALQMMSLNPQIERSHKSMQSSHRGKLASETDMLVRCLETLFLKRRSVSRPRLLAFAKRLAECALQFPERSCLVSLKVLKALTKEHAEAAALLTTEDRVGRGEYIYNAQVPEQANAEVSTVWEIALLSKHFDPSIREAVNEIKR